MQPPSPTKLETQQEEGFFSTGEEPNNGGLCLCDFCSEAPALLYCRADEARLCLSCDRQVHAANSVSSRHPRALLCDWCRCAPSSSLCCTQRLLLCHNCDFDAHHQQLGGGHHVRRPVEPFSGCPGSVELMGLLGAGEDEKGLREGEEGGGEGGFVVVGGEQQQNQQWAWEEEGVLNLDDLIVPMDSGHGFQAAGVPPLPKDRNLSCGKHKEEIMRQLRRLLKSEFDVSDLLWDREQDVKFQPPVAPESLVLENEDFVTQDAKLPDNDQVDFLLWEDCHSQPAGCLWISHDQLMKTTTEDNQLISDSMDGGNGCNQIQDTVGEMENDHPISTEMMPLASPRACGLSGAERNSAISRYREKRKTRRYDKRIIYESRRARAESRVRIKGRFAKMNLEPKS